MPVTRLDIVNRTPFTDGQSFDNTGPYQYLEGKAHFSVDPLHDSNEAITDLKLAPRGSDGRVSFSADFAMLQPWTRKRGTGGSSSTW